MGEPPSRPRLWSGLLTGSVRFDLLAKVVASRPAHAYGMFGLDLGRAMPTYCRAWPSHAQAPDGAGKLCASFGPAPTLKVGRFTITSLHVPD